MKPLDDIHGEIFNIQRFSIHDGPGIRTTVFFKGCPLRCFWCHNPEGLRKAADIQFYAARCIGCGACVSACPEGAQQIIMHADGSFERIFDRALCNACGECVDTCFSGALEKIGQEISAQDVVTEVLRDRGFYTQNSGGGATQTSGGATQVGGANSGGVTLSGGEPMLQPAFARAILAGCKAQGIHTALETSTCYRWEILESALPLTDLFMIDIKHLDDQKHRAATGVSNVQILANIRRLAYTGKPVIFRTPTIPGVNDTPEEIGAIAAFIHELSEVRLEDGTRHPERFSLELLAFHQLAADKYRSLGLEYPAAALQPPSKAHMTHLAQVAEAQGIAVRFR